MEARPTAGALSDLHMKLELAAPSAARSIPLRSYLMASLLGGGALPASGAASALGPVARA